MKKLLAFIVILCTILILAGCLHDTPGPDQPTVSTGDATKPSYKPHIHQYRITEEHEATCTDDGYNIVSCVCGDGYRVTNHLALGHNYRRTDIIPPTETEGGYTLYTCQRCGAEKRSDETESLEEIEKPENIRFKEDNEGKLFYYYESGKNSTATTPVCNEPVECYANDGIFLFFVKKSEPRKLYYAPLTNLAMQEPIYESDCGDISFIQTPNSKYLGQVLTLTEGYKRGVILDLSTFEIIPIDLPSYLYRIEWVSVDLDKDENGNWVYDDERISIAGQLTPNDHGSYFLDIHTGLIQGWDSGYVMINGAHLSECIWFDNGLLFVKKSEQGRVYHAPSADYSQHTIIFESTGGEISGLYSYGDMEYICMTLNHKQAILLDINTGKTQVFLERPLINRSRITDLQIIDGAVKYNVIYFEGKKSADDYGSAYLYYIDTGVYEEVGQGWW